MSIRALSPEMEDSVRSVEEIVGYCFRRKKLLEEALTHSSFSESFNYERLEFVGDAVLGLATTNHLVRVYPYLDPGKLSLLRAANVSTERLARVALRKGLVRYIRHNAPSLLDKVREFVEVVSQEEDDLVTYGGSVKAPKVLADIVESVAAAVYVDVNYDLHMFWRIFRGVLEPLVASDDLKQQPQPVTMLYELCQKQGKEVLIKHWQDGGKIHAVVYVNEKSVATAVSDQKNIARLNAARAALPLLANSDPTTDQNLWDDIDGPFEIQGAKQKLREISGKMKWSEPVYNIESDSGPPHDKKFVCSVRITTEEGIICMVGEDKSRRKEAENSAASLMIRASQIADFEFK